jgi:hypothetical protein
MTISSFPTYQADHKLTLQPTTTSSLHHKSTRAQPTHQQTQNHTMLCTIQPLRCLNQPNTKSAPPHQGLQAVSSSTSTVHSPTKPIPAIKSTNQPHLQIPKTTVANLHHPISPKISHHHYIYTKSPSTHTVPRPVTVCPSRLRSAAAKPSQPVNVTAAHSPRRHRRRCTQTTASIPPQAASNQPSPSISAHYKSSLPPLQLMNRRIKWLLQQRR